MHRYLITDRRLFGGLPGLLEFLRKPLGEGLEYLQIREKDLTARELFDFTRSVVDLRGNGRTKILVNGRADIAQAAGADGVHFPAEAADLRLSGLIVARSCHSFEEIRRSKASFVTFSPIFATPGKGTAVGLAALAKACRLGVPVFALGGVSWQNAQACIEAGAAGVAGIRLFASG